MEHSRQPGETYIIPGDISHSVWFALRYLTIGKQNLRCYVKLTFWLNRTRGTALQLKCRMCKIFSMSSTSPSFSSTSISSEHRLSFAKAEVTVLTSIHSTASKRQTYHTRYKGLLAVKGSWVIASTHAYGRGSAHLPFEKD